MARTIPPGDGVALPYGIVADVADREFVWSTESLLEMAASGQPLPAELVWLGVAGRDASGFGRWAIDAGGFRAVAAVGSRMMLLTRAPVTPRWDLLGATAGACPSPALDWSEHGVRLCEARWEADGHVMVAVERVGAAAVRIGITPPGQDEPFIDVRGLRGLIPVHHTEVGWIVPLRSISPIDAPAVDVVLTTPEGIRERLRLPRPRRQDSDSPAQ